MQKIDWISSKVYELPALLHKCNQWRYKGKQIVFTNGCFDILHKGHLDYLAKAASEGSILIVGLNSDASTKRLKGEERPLNNEADRAFALASLLVVDAVIIFEEDTPLSLIESLKPDVLAKGGDYNEDNIVGAKETTSRGGRVAVIPFVEGYSTTGLVEKIRAL